MWIDRACVCVCVCVCVSVRESVVRRCLQHLALKVQMSHLTVVSFKLLNLEATALWSFKGFVSCTAQQLPVGGSQLVSHTANTHLNMSRWSPTRSPHQPGANYFSRGVQPGPRLGSFPFSLLLFPPLPCYHRFYFRVLPKRQSASIWQERQMLGTVARMCGVTRTSWWGRAWPFNLRWVFREAKWLWW